MNLALKLEERQPDLISNIKGATVKVYNGSVFKWAGMTQQEVAADFEAKLEDGNAHAIAFNNACCEVLEKEWTA